MIRLLALCGAALVAGSLFIAPAWAASGSTTGSRTGTARSGNTSPAQRGDTSRPNAPTGRTRSGSAPQRAVNWQERDTATYVVSTVNVVRSGDGRALRTVAAQQLHVVRYDVFADLADNDVYFVQMKRDDGSIAGALAYQMGWSKPRSISQSLQDLGVASAPSKYADEYKNDPKKLIGTFKSTLPT